MAILRPMIEAAMAPHLAELDRHLTLSYMADDDTDPSDPAFAVYLQQAEAFQLPNDVLAALGGRAEQCSASARSVARSIGEDRYRKFKKEYASLQEGFRLGRTVYLNPSERECEAIR